MLTRMTLPAQASRGKDTQNDESQSLRRESAMNRLQVGK